MKLRKVKVLPGLSGEAYKCQRCSEAEYTTEQVRETRWRKEELELERFEKDLERRGAFKAAHAAHMKAEKEFYPTR